MKIYRNITDFNPTKKVFLTVGTFDGIHFGHQKLIESLNKKAHAAGGESVMLTFAPHPRLVLFPEKNSLKLINTLEEKIERLEKSGIDHLIIYPFTKEFSRISAIEYVRDFLVKELKVSTLIIGYDHQFGRNREGNFNYLKELSDLYQFEVEEISAQDINEINVSSTKIRNAILIGNIYLANEYLGYSFSLTGEVIEGKRIGHTIGFPTANLYIEDAQKIIPMNGAYAAWAKVGESWYKAMLNIGTNPTVNSMDNVSVEVHLLNFSEDIYGREITLKFVKRLRSEVKFEGLDQLKNQLRLDKSQAEKILEISL
ncbi:MAG: bifunctional riboflavin kinase/FAD synthetase [Flavobacteriales bacterium]